MYAVRSTEEKNRKEPPISESSMVKGEIKKEKGRRSSGEVGAKRTK